MAEAVPQVVRFHSDNGKELITKTLADALAAGSVYKTTTIPYNPQQNGRAERAIRDLKQRTLKYLLSAGAPVKFWPYFMVEASIVQRSEVLQLRVPKGQPHPGMAVVIDRHAPEPFETKVEQATYLCQDEHSSRGAFCLVKRNGNEYVIRARAPAKLPSQARTWRTHVTPSGDVIWLANDGEVRDAETTNDPAQDLGMLTFEERQLGPGDEEGFEFFQVAEAACNKAVVSSDIKPAPEKSSYKVWSAQLEKEAYKAEAQALDEAVGCETEEDSHIQLDGRVFTEGPDWKREKWISGLAEELSTMFESKQALVKLDKKTLRQTLGLSPGDPLPKTLPSKLVITAKPDGIPGADGKIPPVQLDDRETYRAKVRLVACGNYDYDIRRGDPKFKSSNVPPEAIRAIISLVAQKPNWVCALMDIVTAFLNADLDESEVILLRPPPILQRLAKVAEDEIWLVKKAVYGLRAAPKAWEKAWDAKLDNAVLVPGAEDALGALKLVPWKLSAGLWRVVQADNPGEVLGVLGMYVDDGILAGLPEVVQRVGSLILENWNTKLQAVLTNATLNLHAGGTFQIAGKPVKVVQETTFLGTQIRRLGDGSLFLTQEAWIKSELKARGWENFSGTKSLPSINEGHISPQERDKTYTEQLRDCQSQVGALLWVSLRTRPDLNATVGILASHMSFNPSETLKFLKGLWRYLRYTQDFGLKYSTGSAGNRLTTSSDASWSPGGSKSRSGSTVHWGSHLIAFKSQRQTLRAFSPAEAELDAVGSSLQLGCKVQHMIQCIAGCELEHAVQGDNMASIQQLLKPGYFVEEQRTRHFALRCSYVRDHLGASGASLSHCPGTELPADGLTKVLAATKLAAARDMLGVCQKS